MNKLDRLAIITTVAALAIIFVGGTYYLNRINAPEEIVDTPRENGDNMEEEQEEFRRFSSPEFGFSFEYPTQWGDAEFVERIGGQGGTKATIEFSEIDWFIVGGISEDFAEGRGGTPTDTQGFVSEDGAYFFRFVSTGRVPVEPVKSVNTALGEVIIVDHRSFVGDEEPVGPVMTVGGGNLGALVNLDGETYGGAIFLNMKVEEFTAEDFEQMLNTIRPE